jgi:transposase
LKTALRWNGDSQRRQRIQMVLLRASGMTQPAIAAAMGVSLSTVNRAHMAMTAAGSGAQIQAERRPQPREHDLG